jgi:hypothetical protein
MGFSGGLCLQAPKGRDAIAQGNTLGKVTQGKIKL